mmetsp:Transcript_41326/g.81035  ORF Transcript_41326/g.81035 Transcript_41326/m.81035 type:complete len:80 (+) Transcript_41326:2-241(+)
MIYSIREIGVPVFQAGVSTTVAVLPSSFAASQIFFGFFCIIFLVMVFGLLHGLVFLPALLSFVGPKKGWSICCCCEKKK